MRGVIVAPVSRHFRVRGVIAVIPAKMTICRIYYFRNPKNFAGKISVNIEYFGEKIKGGRYYTGFSRTKFLGVRGVIVPIGSGVIVPTVSSVITTSPCKLGLLT